MRKFFEIVAAVTPLLAGVGAAIAFSRSRSSHAGLGRSSMATDRHGGMQRRPAKNIAFDPTPIDERFDDEGDDEFNPWRPPRDEPDYDGGCLILGKKHFRYGDPYRVCLTANQEKKLFQNKRKRLRKLGCGVFACAYEAPAKSRVVKFTRDSEDVAALLKAQSTKVVPKVFAVYKLAQGGRTIPTRDPITMRVNELQHVPVYAMVVEKLRTIPPSEREMVDDELLRLREAVIERKQSGNDFCDEQQDEDGNTGCSDVQVSTLRAIEKLQKAGIHWTDTHAGNIGYDRNGRLKVLDLGVSKTKLEKEPEVLEGRLAAASKLLSGKLASVE